jgi:hypothetical protein
VPEARFLGGVARTGDAIVQIVRVEEILSDALRALLTGEPEESGGEA